MMRHKRLPRDRVRWGESRSPNPHGAGVDSPPSGVTEPVLRVANLAFAYRQQPVLTNVDFQLRPGRLYCLLGGNGSGKTTLMRCLLGLLKPQAGEVIWSNRPLKAWTNQALAHQVAYVPQSTPQGFNYTALEAVLMGRMGTRGILNQPKPEDVKAAREALDQLGVGPLAHRGLDELSGGERQLVLIARGLAQGAQVILLDEPTASLDFGHQYQVLDQVRRLADGGQTFLLTTHQPQHALSYADEILALSQGQLIYQGDPSGLNEALLAQLYHLSCTLTDLDGQAMIVVKPNPR